MMINEPVKKQARIKPASRELILETSDLRFSFNKKEQVLKGLNIQVERGAIYGFLGPNGAGKTTTIRLLLGLLSAPADSIFLFGKPLAGNELAAFSRIGSLIEQPSLYDHLSGMENLEITRLMRKMEKKRVKEVLDLVRLGDAAHKKVKAYSLGMKQRLGLALALLSGAELLILDEPVNGLDPAGIIETRELLMDLNRATGVTIFLSSHLLSEIEKMVTHLGIVSKGQLIFQGTPEELRFANQAQKVIQIDTNNNPKAISLLQDQYDVKQKEGACLEVRFQSRAQIAIIANILIHAGLSLYLLKEHDRDLEKTFIALTDI